ncbi:hypothetical protein K4L04_01175 [Phaeobacter inhibens]|uniref:hypothetical protein n=1 Tax=Phaeobacter inhibens TaxID=221822 RepID=UPI0021A6D5F6|nr:hypothetical protein [Phaeobacter inhibens]UWR40222.1 hypothetical protein K4F85_12315 [Phaeobacter inhibens]UWR76602.1 hypothetical protein K4L04_01175 [Phaeobacter inhibens]
MVAYNFQPQFAEAVENGSKRQTIRARRKDDRHAKRGDKLQLYTGMRTKACRKLRDAVCHDACPILIEADKIWTFEPQELHTDLEAWAKRDGFATWPEMRAFFEQTHGLPFTGVLISWLVPLEDCHPT